MTLRNRAIRLAAARPDLRPHLLPLVTAGFAERKQKQDIWKKEVERERKLAAALATLIECRATATTDDAAFLTKAIEAATHAVNIAEARVEFALTDIDEQDE